MTDDSPFEAGSASVTVRRRAKNGDPESERTFHILGTAHVSQKSIEEVREVIRKVRPDTVCVELDKMRYEALTDDTRWRKLDIFQVIRDGKVLFLMASLALQSFQKRIGEKLGVRPGAELLAAVEIAEEIGAKVVLADRDVQATLKRTWRNLSFVSKGKLLAALVGSLFDSTELEEEEIEALKNRDQITDAMSQLAEAMPEVKGPLIDERDQYLMSAVEDAPGKVVVAVVGAAHVDGMTRHLGKSVDRDKLSEIPQPSLISRSLKWLIPTIILGAFAWGIYHHDWQDVQKMIYAWLLPNAIVAGLFTLLAGGKILSVITAIVASPITSLNPTIGAGMVVGLVEAWLRKPTVADCERLGSEVTTLAGMRKNPVSHIFMVAIAATMGSALGAYIGATWVLTML